MGKNNRVLNADGSFGVFPAREAERAARRGEIEVAEVEHKPDEQLPLTNSKALKNAANKGN